MKSNSHRKFKVFKMLQIFSISALFTIFSPLCANANLNEHNYESKINLLENNPHKHQQSTSGLDSEAQKRELTQVLTDIYSENLMPESFWNDFKENKKEVQKQLGLNDEHYECVIENHNYEAFKKMIASSVNDYVNNHSAEKVHNDLIILIDSGLANEYHDLLKNIINNDELADKLFALHLMQNPYLRIGYELQSSDENLSTLIGLSRSNPVEELNTLPGKHLFQVMHHCTNTN